MSHHCVESRAAVWFSDVSELKVQADPTSNSIPNTLAHADAQTRHSHHHTTPSTAGAAGAMDFEYASMQQRDMHNKCCAGRAWCVQDICGIICAVMTWMLIAYAEFVVMVVIILPSPYPVYSTVNMIIFNLLAFLAYASHMRTMFSDPVSVRACGTCGFSILHVRHVHPVLTSLNPSIVHRVPFPRATPPRK